MNAETDEVFLWGMEEKGMDTETEEESNEVVWIYYTNYLLKMAISQQQKINIYHCLAGISILTYIVY